MTAEANTFTVPLLQIPLPISLKDHHLTRRHLEINFLQNNNNTTAICDASLPEYVMPAFLTHFA